MFEVFVLVDSNGDYAVGKDADSAKEAYENEIQALSDAEGFRLVKLNLAIPLPAVREVSGEIPETEGEPVLKVS